MINLGIKAKSTFWETKKFRFVSITYFLRTIRNFADKSQKHLFNFCFFWNTSVYSVWQQFLMPMYLRYDDFASYVVKTNQSRERAHTKHH